MNYESVHGFEYRYSELVFNGEGFLTNDEPSMSPHQMRSHISSENPYRTYEKVLKSGHFYDRLALDLMHKLKLDVRIDKWYVINEWNHTVVKDKEELTEFLLKNPFRFCYIEYAKARSI